MNYIKTLAKNAQSASLKVSETYQFISTQQVHQVLGDFGFTESKYKEGRGSGYQKHLSIFDRDTDGDGEGWYNLLLLNSHDGSASLRLEAGYFRVLCENQLGSGDVGIRVIHRGNALSKLEQSIPMILAQMETFKQTKALLKDRVLDGEAQFQLATLALKLRGVNVGNLDEYQLIRNMQNMLTSRRTEDRGHNAWLVFNRIQENVVKGGVRLLHNSGTIEAPKDIRRMLRPLTSAERLLDINNTLTQATIELAKAA